MEDLVQRFETVKEAIKELSEKRVRLEERHKTEREKLELLVKEIVAKGYDPQKLSETLETKQAELTKLVTELETGIAETSSKLHAIETE